MIQRINLPTYGCSGVIHPDLIYFPDKHLGYKYWLFYTRYPPESMEDPCLVRSNNGINFTDNGITNPIFTNKDGQFWERDYLADVDAIYNGNFILFYTGSRTDKPLRDMTGKTVKGGFGNVAMAKSPDGVKWSRCPTPVIAKAIEPAVVYLDGKYHMWCHRYKRILYTSSEDLEHWEDPVLTLKWTDRYRMTHPEVVYHDGQFEMYLLAKGMPTFRGSTKDKRVLSYVSKDGTSWVRKEDLLVADEKTDFMPYRVTVFYDERGERQVYASYQEGWIEYIFKRGGRPPLPKYYIGKVI